MNEFEIYNTSNYFENLLGHLNSQIFIASKHMNIQILSNEDERLITFLVATINADKTNTISNYFDSIKNKLKSNAPTNMPYYNFTDGYLLDKDFDLNDFCLAMQNIINSVLIVYEKLLKDNFIDFENNAIKVLNSYLKKYDKKERNMTCFEFLEIIFAKLLKKNISSDFTYTPSSLNP